MGIAGVEGQPPALVVARWCRPRRWRSCLIATPAGRTPSTTCTSLHADRRLTDAAGRVVPLPRLAPYPPICSARSVVSSPVVAAKSWIFCASVAGGERPVRGPGGVPAQGRCWVTRTPTFRSVDQCGVSGLCVQIRSCRSGSAGCPASAPWSAAVCPVREKAVRDPVASRIVLLTGALLLPCIRAVKAGTVTSGRSRGHGILRYGDEAGPGG